jgi:hypothetical protein
MVPKRTVGAKPLLKRDSENGSLVLLKKRRSNACVKSGPIAFLSLMVKRCSPGEEVAAVIRANLVRISWSGILELLM